MPAVPAVAPRRHGDNAARVHARDQGLAVAPRGRGALDVGARAGALVAAADVRVAVAAHGHAVVCAAGDDAVGSGGGGGGGEEGGGEAHVGLRFGVYLVDD